MPPPRSNPRCSSISRSILMGPREMWMPGLVGRSTQTANRARIMMPITKLRFIPFIDFASHYPPLA